MIVGRCADYVLRNYGNCLKVFSRRLLRAESKSGTETEYLRGRSQSYGSENEKLRADNYRYYTRRMWGAAGNFDISLNTDLGEEYIVNCISRAMKL